MLLRNLRLLLHHSFIVITSFLQCYCIILFVIAAHLLRADILYNIVQSGSLDKRVLLLLFDSKSLNASVDPSIIRTITRLDERYVVNLMVRRCAVSYSFLNEGIYISITCKNICNIDKKIITLSSAFFTSCF